MTAILDELYAILTGFGIRRDVIDIALLALTALATGIAVRDILNDPRRIEAWAFAAGTGWLSYACWRYMTKGGAE